MNRNKHYLLFASLILLSSIIPFSSLLWFLLNDFPILQAIKQWYVLFIFEALHHEFPFATLSLFIAIGVMVSVLVSVWIVFYYMRQKKEKIEELYKEQEKIYHANLYKKEKKKQLDHMLTKFSEQTEIQKNKDELDFLIADIFRQELKALENNTSDPLRKAT